MRIPTEGRAVERRAGIRAEADARAGEVQPTQAARLHLELSLRVRASRSCGIAHPLDVSRGQRLTQPGELGVGRRRIRQIRQQEGRPLYEQADELVVDFQVADTVSEAVDAGAQQ